MSKEKLNADEAIEQIVHVLQEADLDFIQDIYERVCNSDHEIVSSLEETNDTKSESSV